MFRKSLIDEFGFYDESGLPEDYELWLRWMDFGVRFEKLRQELVLWRDHPGRLTRTDVTYSKQKFMEVKSAFLYKHLREIANDREIIVCGASAEIRQKANILEKAGLTIKGFTDVKQRNLSGYLFRNTREIFAGDGYFYLNLISKRGIGESIRKFLDAKGLHEGTDYLLAG